MFGSRLGWRHWRPGLDWLEEVVWTDQWADGQQRGSALQGLKDERHLKTREGMSVLLAMKRAAASGLVEA